jgi:hypothetical protein
LEERIASKVFPKASLSLLGDPVLGVPAPEGRNVHIVNKSILESERFLQSPISLGWGFRAFGIDTSLLPLHIFKVSGSDATFYGDSTALAL